jgi:hypothetical protein
MTYDLEYDPSDYCMRYSNGRPPIRIVEVCAATQRGCDFLLSHWEATGRQLDAIRSGSLNIPLPDFDRFKRQASLAGMTVAERKEDAA